MGLVYLTLAHIVIATHLDDTSKRLLLLGGFLATLMDLMLPWGLRYLSPSLVFLFPIAWIAEWIFYGAYLAIPLYDMWIRAPEEDE